MASFRSVGVVLGGILLSFVLAVIFAWIFVRTSEMQLFFSTMRGARAGGSLPQEEATRFLAAMAVAYFRMRWVIGPGVAALVGTFVGLTAGTRAWQMALLAILPFAVLLSFPSRDSSAVPFAALYIGVAGLAAWGTSKARRGKRPAIRGGVQRRRVPS